MTPDIPWLVAVPVKEANFEPLDPAATVHNVEVDPGVLPAFLSGATDALDGALLHADLQTPLESCYPRMLGSGRAGYHKGAFLKGVGRTPLAANWVEPHNAYHGSGALFASAASREFLVSEYLRRAGADQTIVPCSTLLLRTLPQKLANLAREAFALESPEDLAPCDHVLQAVTVKPGRFARASNIVWWLHRLPTHAHDGIERLSQFYPALWAGLGGDYSNLNRDFDPAGLALRLVEAGERAIRYLLEAWAVGVYWGSTHNNFALDGRFVDLEVPIVFEQPTVGCIRLAPAGHHATGPVQPRRGGMWAGTEALHCAHQLRWFMRELDSRLCMLKDYGSWPAIEREFTAEFLEALDQKWESSVLRTNDALIATMVATMSDALELDSKERASLEALLRLNAPGSGVGEVSGVLVPLEVDHDRPLAEGGRYPITYVPPWLRERSGQRSEAALDFNQALVRADSCADTESLFRVLDDTRRTWREST